MSVEQKLRDAVLAYGDAKKTLASLDYNWWGPKANRVHDAAGADYGAALKLLDEAYADAQLALADRSTRPAEPAAPVVPADAVRETIAWQPLETADAIPPDWDGESEPERILLCSAQDDPEIGYVTQGRDGTRYGVVMGLPSARWTHWAPLSRVALTDPAPAGEAVEPVQPFVYLREHDMRALAMPASRWRDGVRIYRVPEHEGEKLHPLFGLPAVARLREALDRIANGDVGDQHSTPEQVIALLMETARSASREGASDE